MPGNGTALKLDFDVFDTASSSSTTVALAPSATGTSSQITSSTSAIATQSTSTAASMQHASNSSATRTGVGVGVSLGVILIALVGLWAYFHHRPRRQRLAEKSDESGTRPAGYGEFSHGPEKGIVEVAAIESQSQKAVVEAADTSPKHELP